MKMKIGLTMRIVNAIGYNEPRDALAQDWARFMKLAMPEAEWVMLPNIGKDVVNYIKALDLNGFILTGGNDIGSEVLRDETEKSLLGYSIENNFPVFGVCRGLQLIQVYFGGKLQQCSHQIHVNQKHDVKFTDNKKIKVNSYHNQGVEISSLSDELNMEASSDEGIVEMISVKNKNIKAVMWHPERENPPLEFDIKLIRSFFGLDN